MIAAEAVEAAAKAMRANEGYDWDDMGVSRNVEARLKEIYRKQAQNILEAAAPYMLGAAWEEGRLVGRAEVQSGFDTEMNPYAV